MEELAKQILALSAKINHNIIDSNIYQTIHDYNILVSEFGVKLAEDIYINGIDKVDFDLTYKQIIAETRKSTKTNKDAETKTDLELGEKEAVIKKAELLAKKYQKVYDVFKNNTDNWTSYTISDRYIAKNQTRNNNLGN